MNKVIIDNRTFLIKAIVRNEDVTDELKEKLKNKFNVKTVLKDNNNNLVFVDEIVDAHIINEVQNEV